MSKLVYKVKPEFKGKVIRRQIEKMGEVTLDLKKVKPSEYDMYVTMGFEDIFEVEETVREYALVEAPEEPKVKKEETEDEDEQDDDDLNLNLEDEDDEAPEEPEGEEPKAKATPKAKRTAKK